MSGGALIIMRQKRYIRAFQEAGATAPSTAKTLEEVRCRPSWILNRLVARGVLIAGEGNRYYLDVNASDRLLAFRRRIALWLIVVFLAIVLLLTLARGS